MSEAIEQYVRYKEGLGEKPRVKKYVLLSFGKYVGLSMQLDCVAERSCSEYLHQKGFKSNVATQYWFCIYSILEGFFNWAISAQRKIPVVLSFPYHRHKAGGASPLA